MPPRDFTTKQRLMFARARTEVRKKLQAYEVRTIRQADLQMQAAANEAANIARREGNWRDQTANLRNSIFTNPAHLKTDFNALPETMVFKKKRSANSALSVLAGVQAGGVARKVMPRDLRPKGRVMQVSGTQRMTVVGVGMNYGRHLMNKGYNVLMSARFWLRATLSQRVRLGLYKGK